VFVDDLGWEIYPDGIAEACRKLHDITPLPIYITENGTCDNTDTFRSRYIYEHLKVLCGSGLPVQRYYHWCFCDNFEWLEGESARFGLVHIDYATQKRTVKESGRFYSEMIAQRGVSEALYDRYCRQDYHTAEEKR
jgi:beta-glucosidase